MVALPIAKLFYLGMRQISKPFATRLKESAKGSDFVRKTVLIPPAQGSKKLTVNPLSDAAAIELGAELLSEGFIFGVGSLCIILEFMRQKRTQIRKDENLNSRIEKLENIVNEQEKLIDKLSTKYGNLELQRIENNQKTDEVTYQ